MDYIAASFRHRSACSRTIKTNCSNAGDRHFFRCNANCVATRCDSSFQFSFTSLPSSSSLRTVTRGKKETPSPEITHCLIASMLQNSKFESLAFVSDVLLYSRHAALRNRDNVTQHADPNFRTQPLFSRTWAAALPEFGSSKAAVSALSSAGFRLRLQPSYFRSPAGPCSTRC